MFPSHLLDTHAWIWFFEGEPRAEPLRRLPAETRLGISALTPYEAARLETEGKVRFHPDLETRLRQCLAEKSCVLVPLLPEISLLATRLPGAFPGDEIDRLLVATAIATDAMLVTADPLLLAYESDSRLRVFAL